MQAKKVLPIGSESGIKDCTAGTNASAGQWYVAMTQPRQEELAVINLERQNFYSFLPRQWVLRRHRSDYKRVLQPVFPSYVFVRLDLDHDRWRSINGTYGVAKLLSFGEKPTCVPTSLVETLQLSTAPDGSLVSKTRLCPGDSVRLIDGPLADRLGVLETLDPKGRVNILLELLGGNLRVRADASKIERADDVPS
jgi:transcription elongation factor/antiterminator RfaH